MDGLDGRISISTTSDPGNLLAIRTRERIHILEWNGELRQAFLIPDELRDKSFEFYTLDQGPIYLTSKTEMAIPNDSEGEDVTRPLELVRAKQSGEVTERTPISLSQLSYRDRGLSQEATLRIVTAAVPATLWSAGFAFGFLPEISAATEDDLSFLQALKQWAEQLWWVVLLVAVLSGWLAWLAFKHQCRQGEPYGWFWAIFVFLFGLPGYLGYRLHRSSPHSEPIPTPKPTGLEVFAH